MFAYIVRRIALIPLTLLGIITLNFMIVQVAPGGPVERVLAQLQGLEASSRLSTNARDVSASTSAGNVYRGGQGLDPELVARVEKQFGFDKPPLERYLLMIKNYVKFDLGESYYRSEKVLDLILAKLPVSISLGLWTTIITYLVSIPLGIRKAVHDGSRFDIASSYVIIIGYAIPAFMLAVVMIVVFSGGEFLDWFPLRGLTSEGWAEMSPISKALDYLWHITMPVIAMTIGGFASLTMLTKNSFLEEIRKQYVLTARAKGLSEHRVLYGHIFRNAMLLVISGFPAALISILFTSAVLIEVIFSLDGLGLLSFESTVNRDYPVIFGSLYIFSLIGLVVNLLSDLTYHLVDRRIDFAARNA